MFPDFSKIFHHSSKDHFKGHPPIPDDFDAWPDEWKTTYYKTYARFPKIALDSVTPEAHDLFAAIQNRKSKREFSEETLSLRDLSLLLKYSCGNLSVANDGRHRRAHPSGGGRYPIETYALIFKDGDGIAQGVYHYNVKENALDVLSYRDGFSAEKIDSLFSYRWVKNASAAIVMTSVFWRNQNKYGERGYRYILLEAGHIGQNMYLISSAVGLTCASMGGTRDEPIEKLLDIDGVSESIVYALVVGK